MLNFRHWGKIQSTKNSSVGVFDETFMGFFVIWCNVFLILCKEDRIWYSACTPDCQGEVDTDTLSSLRV